MRINVAIDEFPPYGEKFEREIAKASREDLRKLQGARLVEAVRYAWAQIPFYRRLWSKHGVTPNDIKGIDDLEKLPTWGVNDQRESLEQNPPFGDVFATDGMQRVAKLLSSGGTTGFPRPTPATKEDYQKTSNLSSRTLGIMGVTTKDMVQVTYTISTMGASWAMCGGADILGATLLPTSSGNTTPTVRQIEFMERWGTTVLCGGISYILHLTRAARERGVDPAKTSVKKILVGGEVATAGTIRRLRKDWNAEVYDAFGTMEIFTWGGICCPECVEANGEKGMHLWEDAIVAEILDENYRRVPDGTYGNLTLTNFSYKTGLKIRFRMGDASALYTEPCSCGRTLVRLAPITGRVDDMLRIRLQNVWPASIDAIIKKVDSRIDEYVIIADKFEDKDRLLVRVESAQLDTEVLTKKLHAELKMGVGINCIIEVVPLGTTADMTGTGKVMKVKRVFDLRKK